MKPRLGRCLPILSILMLILFAPMAEAQSDSPPPDQAGASAVEGDPFADSPGEDPFANFGDLAEEGEAQASEGSEPDSCLGMLPDIHGYLESRNRVRTTDGEAISLRQRLWLESEMGFITPDEPGKNSPARLFASAALDFDPAASDLSDDVPLFHPQVKELFFTWESDSMALILGRKLERIGTGDGINPMDLINPVDYRDPLATGRADSRLPVLMAKGVVRLPTSGAMQEAGLELFFIPFPQVNQLNNPGSPWESPGLKRLRQANANGALVLRDQLKPSQSLANAEYGARLAGTISGWDLALVGFYGFTNSPVMSLGIISDGTGASELEVTPIHPSFAAVGFNFAKGLELSTIRGEISLKPNLPVMMSDLDSLPGYERKPVVEGVLGWDRTFGANLYVNLQLFCTALGDASNLEKLVTDQYEYGITYDVHDLFWEDALTAGVRGIASFSGEGLTFELFGDYDFSDAIQISASILLFEGPEDGQYGQFDKNDFVSLTLRYSF